MSAPDQSTPAGNDFPAQYDPKSFEDRIYAQWEKTGAFHSVPTPGKKPYSIMIPPPNVTGVLHIGHAVNNTLQDVLIRFKRMQGLETLWMPGTDHAGIATQNVVEKQLQKTEGKSRYQIGRAELIKRCWEWKEQYGGTILNQLRKIGASCDWERTRFTMDEGLSKAVRHAFVRLFNEGLIYRGKYLVNWCPRCRTTLSDDEVEHEEVKGRLYELKYPLVSPKGDRTHLIVATTRPETMLGDTAVAVHPDDERYKAFIGTFVELPLTGRRIPVIADAALDLSFGTGCLKVTPAHDPVDYQIGLRHKLPIINIFTEDGRVNNHAPEQFRGMTRHKAREAVLKALEEQGLLGESKVHVHQVGHCYRCHTMIEPYLSAQWFVKMKPLSELAVKATADGRVKFYPERWTKVYLQWFDEVRDWAISRQLWWGHQIPVWYDVEENKEHIQIIEAGPDEPYDLEKDGKKFRYLIGEGAKPIVSVDDPSALPQYQGRTLVRDADVLDTWFSSGLWPFSTLGWPDKTPELDYYYPTSTLVTDRGIIYFWVARMVMLGEKMMGREPFKSVVINGTVLDGDGKKMSKMAGNGINPLDVIDRYGADAMRFTLCSMSTSGQDLKFPVEIVCPFCSEPQDLPRKRSVPAMACRKCKKEFQQPVPNEPALPAPPMGALDSKRFERGRNFSNKVWNAARYVLTSIQDESQTQQHTAGQAGGGAFSGLQLRDEDRWILSRLNSTIKEVTSSLENYEFSNSIGAIEKFFWNEFCDWYIELTKPRLAPTASGAERAAAKAVLLYTLDRSLRLLHPFCPFISEALWDELNRRSQGAAVRGHDGGLLIKAQWPQPDGALIDAEIEAQFASVFEAVVAVRAVRQELVDNSPKERKKEVAASLAAPLNVVLRGSDAAFSNRLKAQAHILTRMANIETPAFDEAPPRPASATGIKGGTIYVALSADLVDVERMRLNKELSKCEQFIPKMEEKLRNENFVKNAPPELVAEERNKLEELRKKQVNLRAALKELN